MNVGQAVPLGATAPSPVDTGTGTNAATTDFAQLVDGAAGAAPVPIARPEQLALRTDVSTPQLVLLAGGQLPDSSAPALPDAALAPVVPEVPSGLAAEANGTAVDPGIEQSTGPQRKVAGQAAASPAGKSGPPAAANGLAAATGAPMPAAAPSGTRTTGVERQAVGGAAARDVSSAEDDGDGDAGEHADEEQAGLPADRLPGPDRLAAPQPAGDGKPPTGADLRNAGKSEGGAEAPQPRAGSPAVTGGSQAVSARRGPAGLQANANAKGSTGPDAGTDHAVAASNARSDFAGADGLSGAASAPIARGEQAAAATALSGLAEPTVAARAGQFGHEIGVQIARRIGQGGDELIVRLDPKSLGHVEVRLAFDDGAVRAIVAADSPVALDMLRRETADLNRALGDAGIRTDAQSFRFDSRSGERGGGGQQQSAPGEPRSAARTEQNEHSDPPTHAVRWAGRVHLMA